MSAPPVVIYWNNIPSPYVIGRLNAVALRGNLRLEAWFEQERHADRSWEVDETQWKFEGQYLGVGPNELQRVGALLSNRRPDLLISLFHTPIFAFGFMTARNLGIRTAFRVLPTFDSWQTRTTIREITKHQLFRAVDAVKVPGPDGRAFAMRYGTPSNRVHQVAQSIDLAHYSTALHLSEITRVDMRRSLNLRDVVFLYTGRLWSGKGLDTLFAAYRLAAMQRNDISLLVIGDGVDADRYRTMSRELPSVVMLDFVQPRELPKYYGIADVFVFPTLGDPHGLVVEESMAAGLPVISSSAAGDIRLRLPDGRAGFIVPPGNADALAARMLELAGDPDLRRSFGAAAKIHVANKNHEHYAEDFERFVEKVLSMPRRFTLSSVLSVGVGGAVRAANRMIYRSSGSLSSGRPS